MRKLSLVVLTLAVVALVGGYLFWQQQMKPHSDEIVLHGNVDIRQVASAFEISGRIVSMSVEEGDHVQQGQPLAQLDTQTLQLQLNRSQALINLSQAQLNELQNGTRPQEIARAQAALEAAKAQQQLAQQRLNRLRKAAQGDLGSAVSKIDLDNAVAQFKVARADAKQAQEALALAQEGPREELIVQAQARLAQAQAEMALLKHQLEQSTLNAPTDATIRARLAEPGDMTSPQSAVYTLALTQPKWVRVFIPETDLSRIKPGQAAQVYSDSAPDTPVKGTVGYISSVAEFTPKAVQTETLRTALVYEVRVRVDDAANLLRLGMPATVRLQATQ